MKNHRAYLYGAFLGLLSVLLGALGAHSLKSYLTPEQLTSFETGVRYQMYHAFALLCCGILGNHFDFRQINRSVMLFLAGIFCFSFSIYLLSTKLLWGAPPIMVSILGPITPVGGILLAAGWLNLFLLFLKTAKKKST